MFIFGQGLTEAERSRLRRIERKLDLILAGLGIDDSEGPDALPEEVRRLADAGEKIAAIKAHRAAFGSSLLDAKNAVEDYLSR